jgi:hypothetical protein
MNGRRFSEMDREELEAVMQRLREEQRRAKLPNEAEMLERKYDIAKSYTLSPADFPPGRYRISGYEHPFELEYLNGIMAWGRMDGEEASFPISRLIKDSDAAGPDNAFHTRGNIVR